jgi:Fic-DOC domain mobile mystery protein B
VALGDSHARGATPLEPDELADLIPDHISTQGELNESEQSNIIQGQWWALRSRKSRFPGLLTDVYVRELHREVFDQTWKWAGHYRTSGKNIGIDWRQIPEQVRVACENARYWVDNETFSPLELSVRLHHRLAEIHPFPNGNGRHARLIADLLLMKHFKLERLPWGGQNLGDAGDNRDSYLSALRAADRGDFVGLIEFAGKLFPG